MVVTPTHARDRTTQHGELSAPLSDAFSLIKPKTRMVAICTGAFVLAAAGLLEGRPVTTHWREADRLARLFPE